MSNKLNREERAAIVEAVKLFAGFGRFAAEVVREELREGGELEAWQVDEFKAQVEDMEV